LLVIIQASGGSAISVRDINESLAKKVAEETRADFWTTDYKELLTGRPAEASPR
jgi:hypothetical protein